MKRSPWRSRYAARVYRLEITVTRFPARARSWSSYLLFAPGADEPFIYTAYLDGDGDGARAVAEATGCADRHAKRRDPTVTRAELATTWVEVEATRDPTDAPVALAALAALTDALDELAATVRARFAADVKCQKGCDQCCHQQVGISRVEAARVEAHVASMSAPARAALAATVATAQGKCGALDADGGCQIYAGRPVVCRSHGLVYWNQTPSLTAMYEFNRSCLLNYQADAPVPLVRVKPARPPDVAYVYDYDGWNARILAIDRGYAEELGLGATPSLDRTIRLGDVLARVVAE